MFSLLRCCFSLFVFSFVFFLLAAETHAGVIVNRPLLLGLNSGLVGYWTFDGNDLSGNTAFDRAGTNNGTLTNGPRPVIGRIGQALEFDGVNDYVNAGQGASVTDISVKTISAWFKMNGLSQQGIVSKDNVSGGASPWIFFINSSNGLDFQHVFSIDGARWRTENNVITTGSWYHVVLIYNKESANNDPIMYINGVSQSITEVITPQGSALSDATINLQIGSYDNGATGLFNGLIDEVRIYNRVLSADEIKRLYNMGSSFKINKSNTVNLKNGLVGYWTFDGGDLSGTTAFDRAGTNNGTLTNGPRPAIGKIGQALETNAADEYINIGDPASEVLDFGTENFAVSFWVKSDGYVNQGSSINGLVGKKRISSVNAAGYGFFFSSDNLPVFTVGDGTAEIQITATTDIKGTWHHIVGLRNRGINQLYIDGNKEGTDAIFSTSVSNSQSLVFAADPSGLTNRNLDGILDEVRVYNRALSGDEIKRLYNMGSSFKINKSNTSNLRDGLVGYWTFDGNDLSGTTALDRALSNNGTLTNGPRPAIGKIGQALEFDGVNDYVGFPQQTFSGDFSVSVWMYPNNLPGIFIGHDTVNSDRLEVNSTVMEGKIFNSVFSVVTDPDFLLNEWQHLIFVRKDTGGVLTVYRNGILVGSGTESGAPADGGVFEPNTIGGHIISSDFDGLIDEVRIYNRALSGDEIKRLYNMGR